MIAVRKRLAPVLVTFALLSAGCGGKGGGGGVTGPNPNPNPNPTGNVTAKVNGAAWTGSVSALGAILAGPGFYSISAFNTASGSSIILSLWNIGAAGTYPLGVNATNFGGVGLYTTSAGGWNTPLSGVAGSVTITTLTGTRMAGTFQFTATPVSGSAAGTITVTEGAFDLPVTVQGSGGPPPPHAGSRLSATLDGNFYNAGTIAGSHSTTGAGSIAISGLNTRLTMSLNIVGVPGPDDYTIGSQTPFVRLTVTSVAGDTLWGGATTGGVSNDSGTITITSLTSQRMTGTFSGTIAPGAANPAPASMIVTDGSFDIGLPQPPGAS